MYLSSLCWVKDFHFEFRFENEGWCYFIETEDQDTMFSSKKQNGKTRKSKFRVYFIGGKKCLSYGYLMRSKYPNARMVHIVNFYRFLNGVSFLVEFFLCILTTWWVWVLAVKRSWRVHSLVEIVKFGWNNIITTNQSFSSLLHCEYWMSGTGYHNPTAATKCNLWLSAIHPCKQWTKRLHNGTFPRKVDFLAIHVKLS